MWYAEADPTLDINGGDAGHKLILLIKLAFGIDVTKEDLSVSGIENITKEDIDFASEIDSKIKLICYAKKVNGDIYATVRPMLVKNSNFLSDVCGATNVVRINNKYSGIHFFSRQRGRINRNSYVNCFRYDFYSPLWQQYYEHTYEKGTTYFGCSTICFSLFNYFPYRKYPRHNRFYYYRNRETGHQH